MARVVHEARLGAFLSLFLGWPMQPPTLFVQGEDGLVVADLGGGNNPLDLIVQKVLLAPDFNGEHRVPHPEVEVLHDDDAHDFGRNV